MPNRTLALMICAIWLGTAPHAVAGEAQSFGVVTRGARAFYEMQKPGTDAPDLMVRDGSGARKLVDGTQGVVKAFLASPTGDKLAVLVAHGETASLSVYDAATAARIAGPIAAEGSIAGWSEDARTLYFTSRSAGALRLMAWSLRSAPTTMRAYGPDAISLAMRNGEVLLLADENTQTHRLLAIETNKPLATARELMVSRGLTLEAIYPAADGIYVLARNGAQTRLIRIAAKTDGRMRPEMPQHAMDGCRNCRSLPMLQFHRVSEIDLPEGSVAKVLSDPETPGIAVVLDRHGAGRETLRYDPSAGQFISGRTKPLM